MGFQLLRRLPSFLRNPLTIAECRAILHRRLERRENDFLDLMRRAVFANRSSPYRRLLEHAGCEYGDMELLVQENGLESALRSLFHAGVYLTTDEYKGRQPAVRGNTSVAANPHLLKNPLITPHYRVTTSGSRGAATSIPVNLANVRDRAVNMYLSLEARGGAGWQNAVWGIPCISPLLWYSACGAPAARWFSPLNPQAYGRLPRYWWSSHAIAITGRLSGVPVPFPEHVPSDAALPIAGWMARTLRKGEIPHLWAFPSSAARLCRSAEDAGIDIAGARFTVTGEPVTEACLASFRRVRAEAVPDYGSADSGGSVSQGCLSPEAPDDVHVFSDLNGLIQADRPPFPAEALLLSSIRPTVPFIFLNVSMGDIATVSDRRCGCPMEALGWRTHLHTIRSYEKLTAGGVTFADLDVVRILEEVLPRRFGGGPSDYQLVEDSAGDGGPRLRLLVHPSVAAVDPDLISHAFLEALGSGSGTRQAMALQLRQAGFLRVDRLVPFVSPSGKILHLWAGSRASSGGSV